MRGEVKETFARTPGVSAPVAARAAGAASIKEDDSPAGSVSTKGKFFAASRSGMLRRTLGERRAVKLYLVDGHNLIFRSRALWEVLHYEGKSASREEAERMILRWARRAGERRVLLVYDGKTFPGGHPGNRDEGPLRVRFTDPPAEADDRIVYEARREGERRGMVVVVTGDRALAAEARRAGAETIAPDAFLALLTAPAAEKEKEARFSAEEREALAEEQMRRPPLSPSRRSPEPTSPPVPAGGSGRTVPAGEPPRPSRPAPPDGAERRARYAEKMKKKTASRGKRPSRSRKKRRGF